jgi:hypothetical protein
MRHLFPKFIIQNKTRVHRPFLNVGLRNRAQTEPSGKKIKPDLSTFMKNLFLLFVAVALLCGCQKPAVLASSEAQPKSIHWEYRIFEFEPQADIRRFFVVNQVLFTSYSKILSTNDAVTVDVLLNIIGAYGWEIAWTDGTKFIVKRPAQHDGEFYVTYRLQPQK